MAASSLTLPPLVLGGAGFSYQTHTDPASLPIADIIKQAFDHGMRAIDTSPFYEPSEQLLGQALADTKVTSSYSRSDYILMSKVGRVAAGHWDYSSAGVRMSVERSLERLGTSYLDVVFCHDIEAVTDEEVLDAVRELLEFVKQGKVRHVGLSSYRIDLLISRSLLVRERFGKPIDVVQNWGQLTLQNNRLESEGFHALKSAGVSCICSSSPLAIGLLRQGGVPRGRLGDFHPAPAGLRAAAQDLADYVESQGESLASLALRYALWRAYEASEPSCGVSVLTGISTMPELTENVEATRKLLKGDLGDPSIDWEQVEKDKPLIVKAHEMLGEWVNWTFTIPQEGWDPKLKRVVSSEDKIDTS